MRTALAFIVAPLLVPVVAVIQTPNAIAFTIALIVGYGGMLALGPPILVALRALGWTSGWLAAPIGVLCGMTLWIVTGFFFALSLGASWSQACASAVELQWLDRIWTAAGIGAAVAITFWLIARPDRPQRPAKALSRGPDA